MICSIEITFELYKLATISLVVSLVTSLITLVYSLTEGYSDVSCELSVSKWKLKHKPIP